MSNFRGQKSHSFNSGYVYYERLGTDGYFPNLYIAVKNRSEKILNETIDFSRDASFVETMARKEFYKEKRLLSEKFGINFNFGYYGEGLSAPQDVSEVIDAFNMTLNLKKIYERNKLLIKTSAGGQKALFSWYPTYFLRAFDTFLPKIVQDFEAQIGKDNNLGETLQRILDKYMEDICILGIQKMLDGPEVENSIQKIAPELRDAYKELLQYIGKVGNSGTMASQLYEAYQLDNLKEELVSQLASSITLDTAKMKATAAKMTNRNIYARGGLTLEAFETAIFEHISKNKGGKAIHTGNFGVKADNILAFDIDPTIIYSTLAQAGANREKNIKAFNNLGKKLSNLDEGFIIYSSDKNYKLSSDFSGYSAGVVSKNVKTFLKDIKLNASDMKTLLSSIQQLGKGSGSLPGAILEGQEELFEEILAQDLAYMLFDDYSTIGQKDSSGRSIHILNLNGIMVPLSSILFLLSKAIATLDSRKDLRKIVSVNINAPQIRFLTQEEQEIWKEETGMSPWNYQRKYALEKTTISAKFLSNFRQIISEYL